MAMPLMSSLRTNKEIKERKKILKKANTDIDEYLISKNTKKPKKSKKKSNL